MKIFIAILLLIAPAFGQSFVEEKFQAIFSKESIADKKEIWRSLPPEQQAEIWRLNYQWGIEHLNLDADQIRLIAHLSQKLPTITLEEARIFEKEALDIFPKGKADMMFGTIGPFTTKCIVFISTRYQPSNCPCSVGSSFNMSCNSSCRTSSLCTKTQDGCGFAWLFSCDGFCQVD